MTTGCKRITNPYHACDWPSSIFEDEYDSDLGSRSTSSTLSWSDETEKEAARELRERFEKFEAALYSETNGEDLTEIERTECESWKEHYPHLRVVGKHILPIPRAVDEGIGIYPADYEEVFAFHSSEPAPFSDAASFKLNDESNDKVREAVVDKLYEKVLPTVIRKLEQLTPEKLIHSLTQSDSIKIEFKNNSLEVNGTAYPEKHTPSPSRTYQLSSYIDNYKQPSTHNVKYNQFTQGRKFPTINLNSSTSLDFKNSKPRLKKVPQTSARLTKKIFAPNEYESETQNDKLQSPSRGDRHGILPPIEALAITPKVPTKRANSAMLRFTKTQPRIRPLTSRNKTMFLLPIKDSDDPDATKTSKKFTQITPLIIEEKTNYASSLPPCSGRRNNRRNKLPPRWRY